MKKTKTVLSARILILLSVMLFLAAIIAQGTLSIYVSSALYLSAIITFSISAVLSFIAASKDKEHMKQVELVKKDERLQNIIMRSKAKAFDVLSYIMPITTSFLFLNKLVDTNALLILGVLTLLLFAIQFYYHLKYSKEI